MTGAEHDFCSICATACTGRCGTRCVLPRQFDAYVWFDTTNAVAPLPGREAQRKGEGAEETYPFGL